MPFLTQIDPRAKIKGSRDPLGFQPIWTRFGRQVVHNLTTVTTSLRGFSILLLGLYFAGRAVDEKGADAGELPALFLKFEQLSAYSRVAWSQQAGDERYSEDEIRGIRRVRRNLHAGTGPVRISADQAGQILSNQKTYGLWGLYSVAARNSGWLEQGASQLTPVARKFVEAEYLPRLDRNGESVFPFLSKEQYFEPRGKDSQLGGSLARLLGPILTPTEREFYARHLLACGEDDGQQWLLWQHISRTNWLHPFSMAELREIIKCCQSERDDLLAQRLEHIRQVESVIGPAGQLFGFLLSRDGQTSADIVREVKSAWGLRLDHLDPPAFSQSLSTVNEGLTAETCTRLSALAEALSSGDYRAAMDLALLQNQAVMQERGGDAWIKLKAGRLDVRFRDDAGELPSRDELPDLWTNTYFINSLKLMGYQIEGGDRGE